MPIRLSYCLSVRYGSRFAGEIERPASFVNLLCLLALFYCLGNWLRNYSVYLPFEIPQCTYRRHALAAIDRF